MTTAEKNQFYDKYIKTMHVDISPNGEATIVLGNSPVYWNERL